MTDPQPREVLVFGTSGIFRPSDYPWLRSIRVFLKGGDSSVDGVKGLDGYCLIEMYDVELGIPLGARHTSA